MHKRLVLEMRLLSAALAIAVVFLTTLFSPAATKAADSATAVETSSSQTVAASDYELDYANSPMPDLKVTVSQTKDLTSQGVIVSWTGGKESVRPSNDGGVNFLQIFQCWGEDPDHPGHPDRTTCQYGAFATPGSARTATTQPEKVDPQDVKYTKPGSGWASPPYTSIPFNSATGTKLWDLKRNPQGAIEYNPEVSLESNEFYSKLTSNEVTWAGSDATGVGQSKFEIQTASQSPGLGCGNPKKIAGKFVGQPCWLVVLPRGTADNRVDNISQGGLLWDAWKHHLAIKLGFRPLGVRCSIGVPERQVQGSELVNAAFASWQPDFCGGSVKSAFVISNQFDGDSLDAAASTTSSPLAITTRANNLQANDPLVYAPLAVGGISLSFAIDRNVNESLVISEELRKRNYSAFTKMNITPRLLAKLLTYSYKESLPWGADISELGNNSRNITRDPDFLDANSDEADWQYMDLKFAGLADALVPNSRSYLAERVWKYIMSNKDARDFMAGKPDPYGMTVNPWYCTDAKINPTKVAFQLPNPGFPKADPIERPDTTATDPAHGGGVANLVTWRPYISDFESGALAALTGNSYSLGGWNNMSSPPAYSKTGRAAPGQQRVLSLTTTPAAGRYQTFQASLLNSAGQFVAPTTSSLLAAEAAMTPTTENAGVYEYNFESKQAKSAQNAYPLALQIYAALNPLQTDKLARSAYANMIRFAVEKGQSIGTNEGQLPPGYAPLTSKFKKLAISAADAIDSGKSPLESPDAGIVTDPNFGPKVPEKVIAAGVTPKDPNLPLTSASVPTGGALLLCALMFYGLLRNRKARV
ncbi:MAG: hypothetical protein ORN27_09730 [Rhodoluna sp.]|nr:hypothetical protein [Rhodoluna sp.]